MQPRGVFWSIYREALPVLAITLLGGLCSGLVLSGLFDSVADFPGLLVMVPVFLATRGNVYGSLGGRIATGLHQGLIQPRFAWNDRLVNAIIASVANAVGISIVIGSLSWGVLTLLGREPAPLGVLVGIVLIASLLTAAVMIGGLLTLLFAGYKAGRDPDNLVGPIVTTLGDVFGMAFLFLAVLIVEVLVS